MRSCCVPMFCSHGLPPSCPLIVAPSCCAFMAVLPQILWAHHKFKKMWPPTSCSGKSGRLAKACCRRIQSKKAPLGRRRPIWDIYVKHVKIKHPQIQEIIFLRMCSPMVETVLNNTPHFYQLGPGYLASPYFPSQRHFLSRPPLPTYR